MLIVMLIIFNNGIRRMSFKEFFISIDLYYIRDASDIRKVSCIIWFFFTIQLDSRISLVWEYIRLKFYIIKLIFSCANVLEISMYVYNV